MRPRSFRTVQCFTHVYLQARTAVDAGDIRTWRTYFYGDANCAVPPYNIVIILQVLTLFIKLWFKDIRVRLWKMPMLVDWRRIQKWLLFFNSRTSIMIVHARIPTYHIFGLLRQHGWACVTITWHKACLSNIKGGFTIRVHFRWRPQYDQ